tara:strand:+ start:167 stop:964 length:798 start_codon:yes stop_codon:yes gene_type:complete
MSSKIKVDTIENVAGSGNVSLGSGHNLVVPGNISGTGDLAVNTNKIFVDASTDLIGIGTTSPATATGGGIDIHRNGGSSVRIDDTTNSVTGELQVYSAGLNLATVTNHELILSTNNSAKMTITQEGYVKTPSVPRFLARKNTSSWTVSANSIMVWDSTSIANGYNVGSHYNTSNGKFTCPEAGTYYFEATSITNQSVSNGYWTIRKNGSAIQEQHISQSNTSWHAHHISITAEFAANDTVEVYLGANPTGFYGQLWSYFHGRMIG